MPTSVFIPSYPLPGRAKSDANSGSRGHISCGGPLEVRQPELGPLGAAHSSAGGGPQPFYAFKCCKCGKFCRHNQFADLSVPQPAAQPQAPNIFCVYYAQRVRSLTPANVWVLPGCRAVLTFFSSFRNAAKCKWGTQVKLGTYARTGTTRSERDLTGIFLLCVNTFRAIESATFALITFKASASLTGNTAITCTSTMSLAWMFTVFTEIKAGTTPACLFLHIKDDVMDGMQKHELAGQSCKMYAGGFCRFGAN
jgi:hypothetical protein